MYSRLVFIDHTIMFMRLIVQIKGSDSNTKYFDFELTPYPTALFNNNFARKPKKSILLDVLKTKQSHLKAKKRKLKDADTKIESESTNNEEQLLNEVVPLETHVVIDSRALLHQVLWSGLTFK